jgi:hypothetical protein
MYTVPKTRQISEKIREEVPWKETFPVIRGNDDYFPRITRKFSLQGTSSSLPTKICQIFGTVYISGMDYIQPARDNLAARPEMTALTNSKVIILNKNPIFIRLHMWDTGFCTWWLPHHSRGPLSAS